MPAPKILVLPGSIRSGSPNVRLAALATKELTLADADVTLISLTDYPLPLFDGTPEQIASPPASALRLKHMMMAHQGVFIVTPEINAAVPPLLTNAIAWVSRVREQRAEPAHTPFRRRVFAVSSTSRAPAGGLGALLALRQTLELGCGALVIPEQVAIPRADQTFDEMDNLVDARLAGELHAQLERLVEMARLMM
jgi:NAD(P)H-dependent FMN reductase